MIYTYKCPSCEKAAEVPGSISVGPPEWVKCTVCDVKMDRDWQADAPMIDTSNCKDANDIPHKFLTRSAWDKGSPAKVEKQFADHVKHRRSVLKNTKSDASRRQTHAIPAHIVHAKEKQTGDKNYWKDPKNLAKHDDWKVS